MVNGINGNVIGGTVIQAGEVHMTEAVPTRLALQGLPPQPVFVGRVEQVESLLDLLRPEATTRTTAVDGLGGIGKTALVVHVAKLAKDWFPGGMVMIDMRGYEEEKQRVGAFSALGSLLTAMGLRREEIPAEPVERSWLWRTTLAEHDTESERMLIVIDNVSSPDQVLPMLPGDTNHHVLMTSRHRLAGLPGTRLITLPMLPEESATTLLAVELDAAEGTDHRVRADQAATAELVRLCGGLPLALLTATMLLKADPAKPVRELVAALEDEHHRLEELQYEGNMSVRAAFNLSYGQLAEDTRRALRLIAVNRGPAVSSEAAASLMDCPLRTARRVLERLQRASLLTRGAHGLWQMHDLLKLYAAELADRDEERPDAAARLLVHYVREARAAAQHIDPRVPPSKRTSRFHSRTAAVTWADVEYPNLLAAVTLAEELGADHVLRDLAAALDSYFDLRRQAQDWIAVAGAAVRACERLHDQAGETSARTSLGNAYETAGRVREALAEHERVLALTRVTGDRYLESSALSNLGNAHRSLGDVDHAIRLYEESLDIRRELGDRLGEGRTLTNLGIAYRMRGQAERANETLEQSLATTIDYYERDLAVSRELGDQRAEVITLCHLGHAKRDLGRPEEAVRHYEEALRVSHELGDRAGEALALHSLADVRDDVELRSQAHDLAHDRVHVLLEDVRELLISPEGQTIDEHAVEVTPMCCGGAPVDPHDLLDR